MKAYWGSGGTRWRWVVSFTPRSLYPQGKSPWYPSDRRLGGPQSRTGRGSEEKNFWPLPGIEPPIIEPVAQRYTTELSRLLHICLYCANLFLTGSPLRSSTYLHFIIYLMNCTLTCISRISSLLCLVLFYPNVIYNTSTSLVTAYPSSTINV
jgi:hypothetical protein